MSDETFGIIAALPGELKPLVHDWEHLPAIGDVNLWKHSQRNAYAACAGMGKAAAARAFEALCSVVTPTTILSVGYAGSIDPRLKPGDIFYPSQIVDSDTGDHFPLHLDSNLLLITASRVADRGEKYRLALAYSGAALVDMEGSKVAELAFDKQMKFRCVKAVSDGPNEDLPDLNPFITKDGQFATAQFVASVMVRPWHWAALSRFGKNAKIAADNLAVALKKELGL